MKGKQKRKKLINFAAVAVSQQVFKKQFSVFVLLENAAWKYWTKNLEKTWKEADLWKKNYIFHFFEENLRGTEKKFCSNPLQGNECFMRLAFDEKITTFKEAQKQ